MISTTIKNRIIRLVSHHTYTGVDGLDYRILLEADFIVNAGESEFTLSVIKNAYLQVLNRHGQKFA